MKIALLFSGQGAQEVGMASSLYKNSSKARDIFEKANSLLGYDLSRYCFEGSEEKLKDTCICQPAIYVHGYIIYSLLKEKKCLNSFQASLGFSLGTITALVAAGVFDFETGLKIVVKRSKLMHQACQTHEGAMASFIGGSKKHLIQLCKQYDIDIANFNCPNQIVVSGKKKISNESCFKS